MIPALRARPVPGSPRTARSGRSRMGATIAALLLLGAMPAAAQGPEASPAPTDASGRSPDDCLLVAPGTTPPPEPSLDPGASPRPERAGTIPAAGGRLTPGGTYQDWSLGPTVTLAAGDCWAATPLDAGFGLALVWGAEQVPSVVSITEFEGLVFRDPCDATTGETLSVDPTPEGLVGDISQNPYLLVSEPVPAVLGGLPALRVEVATRDPLGCPEPVTWLWAAPDGGGFLLEEGEEATLLLAELNGRTLVAAWETYLGGDFGAFTAQAEALLATLDIDTTTDTYDPDATRVPAPAPSTAPAAPSPSPGGHIA